MTPAAVDVIQGSAPKQSVEVGRLLAVIADPTRWQILNLLSGEQLCTTHLQDLLGAKQTLVSHHLKVLREAGLLDTEPCGRFTYYRLRPASLDGASSALAALADASHGEVSGRSC